MPLKVKVRWAKNGTNFDSTNAPILKTKELGHGAKIVSRELGDVKGEAVEAVSKFTTLELLNFAPRNQRVTRRAC